MDEDTRWVAPSPRLLTVRRVQLALLAVPLLVAGGLLAGALVALWLGLLVAALVLVAAVAVERFLHRRVRSWAYAERDDDFLVRRGVLFIRLSVVPYGRMQFVDVTAGPFERAYGLATVKMHTAAAASDARIPGLPNADATRLRDTLAALGEARAAGL
jgi:membrane protein YdbS with pleckstrin-like domain